MILYIQYIKPFSGWMFYNHETKKTELIRVFMRTFTDSVHAFENRRIIFELLRKNYIYNFEPYVQWSDLF